MTTDPTAGGEAPEPAVPGLFQPYPSGLGPVVPTNEQFHVALAQANDARSLHALRQAFVAWEAVASRCRLAFDEVVRLAVQRLEVERKLGAILAQTVHQGRPAKRSPEATISPGALPPDVTKQEAAKYRRLAAIPEDVFRQYLAAVLESDRLPTSAGARRFAQAAPRHAKRRRSTKPRVTEPVVLSRVLAAAHLCMESPDVYVGTAKVRARRLVRPNAADLDMALSGEVLVTECAEPAALLAGLRRQRDKGKVEQAVVLLSAEVWAPWFGELQGRAWSVCFLRNTQTGGTGSIVAHLGARASAFRIAFGPLGPVLEGER